jgi:hypothetical protein
MLWSALKDGLGNSWWRLSLCLWWGCCSWYYTVSPLENLIGEISLWSQNQAGWGHSKQLVSPHLWTLWIMPTSYLGLLKSSVSNVWLFSTKDDGFKDVLVLLLTPSHPSIIIFSFLHLLILFPLLY